MSEYGRIHRSFCFEGRRLGDFANWASTTIKRPDVEVPVEPGQMSVKTLCPCCVFWRGVLVGGLLGMLVGFIV